MVTDDCVVLEFKPFRSLFSVVLLARPRYMDNLPLPLEVQKPDAETASDDGTVPVGVALTQPFSATAAYTPGPSRTLVLDGLTVIVRGQSWRTLGAYELVYACLESLWLLNTRLIDLSDIMAEVHSTLEQLTNTEREALELISLPPDPVEEFYEALDRVARHTRLRDIYRPLKAICTRLQEITPVWNEAQSDAVRRR